MGDNACKKCPNCDAYWVTPQDAQCLFCGLLKPYGRRKIVLSILDEVGEDFPSYVGLLLAAVEVLLAYLLVQWLGRPEAVYRIINENAGPAFFFSTLFLGAVNGWLLKRFLLERWLRVRVKSTTLGEWIGKVVFGVVENCLRRDKALIEQRLDELEARRQRILSARGQVQAALAGEGRAKALGVLDMGDTLVRELRGQYKVKGWEIQALGWGNKRRPLTADWGSLTFEECDRRLRELTLLVAEGERMLEGFTAEAELAQTGSGRDCIARLREALEDCRRLHESLANQLAVLATKDIAPGTGVLPSVRASLQGLDADERSTIAHYYRSFLELEDQYQRLESDVEAARQLKEIERGRLLPEN